MKDVMRSIYAKPVRRMFWLLICAIFVFNLLVSLILPVLPPLSRWSDMLLDSILLSIIAFPLLYFFMLRPMINHVTDRRNAEEALMESENRYRSLFNSSRDAIMTLEPPSWNFTSCNPAAVAMFGTRNEEHFVNLGPWELSPGQQPDGRASAGKAVEMIETAMREGSHFFEWTHQRTNGQAFPATVLLSRMEYEGKALLQATVRDITALKQSEEALREREERYRSVVDNIAIGVSVISPDMKILSLNTTMKKWFPHIDVSQSLLCFKAFNDPPGKDICSYCPTIKTLKDGKLHESLTMTPAGDGIRSYRVISSPLFDRDGRVMAAVEMVDDITEHKREEAEREKLINELKEALAKVKTLSGMLPICASCKKIRDDRGYWSQVETYISAHTEAVFTSGICPECEKKAYEEFEKLKNKNI